MKTLPLLLITASAAAIPAYWVGQVTTRPPSDAVLESLSTEELLRALDNRRDMHSESGLSDFASSAAMFEEGEDGELRAMVAGNRGRAEHLIERDLQAALAAAPGTAGLNTRLETLFAELAASNPLLALDYATQISGARQQRATINAILRVWAGQDGSAALAWYADTSEGLPLALREERLQSILAGYGASDPRGALAYAAAMDPSGSSGRRMQLSAYQSVFDGLVESGRVNLALDALATIQDASLHGDLQLGLIQSWAAQNPEAVARYLEGLGGDAPGNAHATLVRAWAELDPARAAAHVSSLGPDHADFGRATASVVAQWTQYDIAGPGEWLNTLPASPEVDRSVAIYTARAAREDPEGAMSWAASIQNDRLRTRMMERVAGEWRQTDPVAFDAFMETGDWSDDQRQRLINASAGDDRGRRGGTGGGGWW
jgi:hypothetical protein